MGKLYNQKSQKGLRRVLRNNMPKAEWILWSKICGKQIKNCKFRRQYGLGKFVVDFYAPRQKLAIEVDGDTHFETERAERNDSVRQKFIEGLGIKLLRFTNRNIDESLDDVLKIIASHIKETPSTSPLVRGRKCGITLARERKGGIILARGRKNTDKSA